MSENQEAQVTQTTYQPLSAKLFLVLGYVDNSRRHIIPCPYCKKQSLISNAVRLENNKELGRPRYKGFARFGCENEHRFVLPLRAASTIKIS